MKAAAAESHVHKDQAKQRKEQQFHPSQTGGTVQSAVSSMPTAQPHGGPSQPPDRFGHLAHAEALESSLPNSSTSLPNQSNTVRHGQMPPGVDVNNPHAVAGQRPPQTEYGAFNMGRGVQQQEHMPTPYDLYQAATSNNLMSPAEMR